MCIRQQSAPASAAMPASSGSNRKADTSLTIVAPASSARRATSPLVVSTERRAPTREARSSITGTTLRSSSSRSTGAAPGRVDSPPTSRISAPSAASSSPCSTAASLSRNSPPSEKESGVTLRTPMRTGSGRVIERRGHDLIWRVRARHQLGQLVVEEEAHPGDLPIPEAVDGGALVLAPPPRSRARAPCA